MTCFSFGCAAGDLLIGRPCEASAADPDWAAKSERVARNSRPSAWEVDAHRLSCSRSRLAGPLAWMGKGNH